ncbi:MAG: hypothetical protein AAFQ54_07225 [Pseudomonadota bacterium]
MAAAMRRHTGSIETFSGGRIMGQRRWMRAVIEEAKASGDETAKRMPFARQVRAERRLAPKDILLPRKAVLRSAG